MSIIVSFLFIIAPFLTIPIILYSIIVDKKHSTIYAILLALAIAIIAYNFNPKTSQDLYRYYYLMEHQYSTLSFTEYIKVMFNNNKLLFIFFCYIISKIGNYKLLQSIIVFTGYFLVFYTILDYAKLKNIKVYKAILIIVLFMAIFYFIGFFSGLAQFLGIAVGLYIFYLEYIKKKGKFIYKLLYILPMLIHVSLATLLIFRILLAFDNKKVKKYLLALAILIILFPSLIKAFLNLFSNNLLFRSFLLKSDDYLTTNRITWQTTYGVYILILQCIYVFIYMFTKKHIKGKINDKFCDLIEFTFIFLFAFSSYYDIFTRFSNFSMLLMNIYLLQLFADKRKQNLIIAILLIIVAIPGLSININILNDNDFNNIFNDMYMNLIYYLK